MITIVGGTYHEICLEPHFNDTVGSGLRACKVMLSLESSLELNYHTFVQKELIQYLDSFSGIYPNFKAYPTIILENVLFYYDYPLSYPHIFPRLDKIDKTINQLKVDAENILVYGFIEGQSEIHGKMVVYDPQSPVNPKAFRKNGSTAERLTIILNWGEAQALSNSNSIESIKEYFFKDEFAEILILKKGALGADVFNSKGEQYSIPVYMTNSVWSIGSGDVFVAVYSYYWFKGFHECEAANKASYATAEYCNSRSYEFGEFQTNENIKPFDIKQAPKGKVYLAGPFFTFAQRWLIDRIRRDLKRYGIICFLSIA